MTWSTDPRAQTINAPGRLILSADGVPQVEITDRTPIRLIQPVYDDLRFPASGLNPPGAASDPAVNTTTGLLEFGAAAQNIIGFQVQLPHGWAEGTELSPHVHWMPSTTNGGSVVWQLDYKIIGIGDVLPAEFSTLTVTQAAGGVANTHLLAPLGKIAMTGQTVSCMLICLLSRMGAALADDFTGVAQLLEVDFHYQIDGFGSVDLYIK